MKHGMILEMDLQVKIYHGDTEIRDKLSTGFASAITISLGKIICGIAVLTV